MNRVYKISDTVSVHGAAENFIQFSADFRLMVRRKFAPSELVGINPVAIADKYKLRGFTFGNFVTQEERFYFLILIKKQLEILAKLRGNNNLGKGILTISFGANGKPRSAAHYNPSIQRINLNRGRKSDYSNFLQGENSFVHEYGHFIDFLQGRRDKGIGFNFASEIEVPNVSKHFASTRMISRFTNIAALDETYWRKLPEGYYCRRIEIFARLFEAAITHHVRSKYKGQKNNVFTRRYAQSIYYPKAKIKKSKAMETAIQILKL